MSSAPAPAKASPGRAVLGTEARLFLREPGSLFWILGFPVLLLAILGAIPGFREPDPANGGQRIIELYVPTAVVLAMIMAGLQAMPPVITGYRERGILRRMSVTPVRPQAVLGAQMGLHGVASLASALLVIVVGRLVFDVALPGQVAGYLLALLLAIVCALALGAFISAVAPTTKIATAIGSIVFFPSMFTAGVWLPIQAMPDLLADIVSYTRSARPCRPSTRPPPGTGRPGRTWAWPRCGRRCCRWAPSAGSAGSEAYARPPGAYARLTPRPAAPAPSGPAR
ncbi:ABC transporter permease [Actinomadura keratinilytica]